ncbi:MAG TPA: M1 family aminopeptidase [Kofleriaceae bacterium]|nr:M1 family aminopeptidase [Kofleriaceae bacterium]
MRFVALALCVACSAPAPVRAPVLAPPVVQPPPPAPPSAADGGLAPPQPTLRLPRNFVPQGYSAALAVDPAQPSFTGAISITGAVSERSSVIWLHARGLKIQHASATRDGATVDLTATPRGEDLLELRAQTPLDAGTWVIAIDYAGTYATVETAGAFVQTVHGTHYVVTQLEAIYARRLFPCVDEPDAKVPWQLTLDIPAGNTAVANMPLIKESTLANGHHRMEFDKTPPIPSYLVAFGVGPFDIVDGGRTKHGTPIRIVALKGRAADAAYAAQVTGKILDLAEAWFDIPYPYPKLDIVTIPITVGFSAMENVGMITMAEDLMLFDPKNLSWGNKREYVATAAHEIAHQWFGDLVTMVWWDDIWLNESFATWLGHKLTAQFEPAWREELGEQNIRLGALGADSIVTARQVREPIKTPDDIANVFDGITYVKGATVLNMFEAYVGSDKFQRGTRDYLKSRAFGNATAADFVAAISKAAGIDVTPGFSTFLDQPGAPEIEMHVACGKGKPRLELAQQRYVAPGSPEPPPGKPWQVPVCVAFDRGGQRGEACTMLTEETGSVELDTRTCPRWVVGNVNGRGDYRTRYTNAQAIALRDEGWAQLTWPERRALFSAIQTGLRTPRPMKKSVLDKPPTKLPLSLALSFVPRMLAGGDRFSVGDAVGFAGSFDRLVGDDQRAKYEGWIRATFGAGAVKVGLLPHPGEDLDAESVRQSLIHLVAWLGRDPDLLKQATDQAASWRDLPEAMRGTILMIAADASPDLHAKLLHDVKAESDRQRRAEMFGALGSVRDTKRFEAALELSLDQALDFREADRVLLEGSNDALRAVAESFARVHKDALVARLPKESVTGAGGLFIWLFTGSCDATKRDEIATYLKTNFEAMPGGKRQIEQALEGMDLCIERRKELGPEVRAWLSGVKLPKPAPAKPAKP